MPPFEYYGHPPRAERVIIMMGSALGTCEEVVDELLICGEKVGVLESPPRSAPSPPNICYRHWPETVRAIAVLDRTKEPARRLI